MGHERRTEEGPERRPSKLPEIMRIRLWGKEYVTHVLSIHPWELLSAAPQSQRHSRPAGR
jgi:hypothetical protein